MLTYFLQVNLCWLMFYGLYYALLSRETFFILNRIYLIISLLCGLIAPFGQLFIAVETTSTTAIMLEPFVVTARSFQQNLATRTEGVWSLSILIEWVYWLGVSVMFLRFLWGILKITKLHKKGVKEHFNGFTVVHTEGIHLPFSFFKYVFINENVLDSQDIPQIMAHEKAHIQQHHSYDVILVEILKIIFWWNPVIYFYRQSLRNIHEYLADAAVLKWVERPIYGRLLIKQSQSGPALALANHFIFSQLKKRISMMTRNRSQRSSLFKYFIAVPVFTILLTLFALPDSTIMAKTKDLGISVNNTIQNIEAEKPSNNVKKPFLKPDTTPLLNEEAIAADLKKSANLYDVPVNIAVESNRSTIPTLKPSSGILFMEKDTTKDDILTTVEEVPEYQGGMPALFKWLGQNIRYPQIARNNGIQGTVFVGFVVEKDGSISNVSIKRSAARESIDTITQVDPVTYATKTKIVKGLIGEDLDDEAIRVVAIMPRWKAGKHKGQVVRVSYVLPIKFKLQ